MRGWVAWQKALMHSNPGDDPHEVRHLCPIVMRTPWQGVFTGIHVFLNDFPARINVFSKQ